MYRETLLDGLSGMSAGAPHIPVMLPEVLAALAPGSGETVVDATFGAGGYTRAFLDAGADVVAFDRDPSAITAGENLAAESDGKLRLVHARFGELADHINGQVDGIVADIGVSSMQIDQRERGFSFQKDGPLDMRMSDNGPTAADVVNNADRSDLTRIIGILGEERQASRIAAEICSIRDRTPFSTTLELAGLVERVIGRRQSDRIHPATRTFQGLRIFVNRELEELADLLLAAETVLRPGGRLVVVTFHSLEDRLVKRFLVDRSGGGGGGSRHLPHVAEVVSTFDLPKRGAIFASSEEAAINPRSRSAKLRFGIRTEAPPRTPDRALFGLPRLPDLTEIIVGR